MKKSPACFPKGQAHSFPFKAGRGNATATIYLTLSRGYDEFKIPYTDQGVRKFHRFSTYESAREHGNKLLGALTTGNADAITLTNQARAAYQSAMEALKESGVPLELAALQFAEATAVLKKTEVSLVEAARDYVKRHSNAIIGKTVAEAVAEFIAAKTAAERSGRHLEDIKYRLGKFRDSFNCNVADVDELALRMFLDGLKRKKTGSRRVTGPLSPRSKNNFRSAIISFFRWAKKKKYLESDWNEFASIETVEDGTGTIEIFTPDELSTLLAHADAKLIPFLVIGAFAGLRSSEFCRLDWKEIGVGEGKFIEVKAANARKTKQRRLVPLSDNLKAWLRPYVKASGKMWNHNHTYLYELLQTVTTRAKVAWKDNGLRHSFISYRVAETQDVNKTALEAGNSPQMIFSNYRELVTPKEAGRWFSIAPDEPSVGK